MRRLVSRPTVELQAYVRRRRGPLSGHWATLTNISTR